MNRSFKTTKELTIDLINRAMISCNDRLQQYEYRYNFSNGNEDTKNKKLNQIELEKIKLVALNRYLKNVESEIDNKDLFKDDYNFRRGMR